ncbi:M56 family metallopeptidase [Dehalobacterium formicoaceticum]|uniref:M56 family metallopeptidase n=1 Tax=Dehalobacterium formicoaceticum TaxID=51515 RepID=A0ABT1Y684_9FIRM|nr:M56 family metallopeptidase [Dehalobacterium formicoaceticum]MCR6546395.1 M56 family metallopeptidase [Dehalobacterium formicoaceticum]
MSTLSGLFTTILNMSITASYVAVIIILVRLLLRKAPKFFSYALWAVLLIRLICPLSFTSDFSFLGLLNIDSRSNSGVLEYVSKDIGFMPEPTIQSGTGSMDSIDSAVNSSLPQAAPIASVNPMQIWMEVLSLIWLAGIVVLLLYSVISYIKIKRQLLTATLVKGNIYESDRIGTAFVCGFIHPKIYVPVGVGDADLSYILEHERTHIQRKDYLIKPLAFFALILHWFNPLMWLSFALMSRDMEMSCDERVLQKMNQDAKGGYSLSLLSLSLKRSGLFTANPLAFGESHVKARIKNVINYKKPVFWVMIASVVVLIGAGITLLSNPQPRYANLTLENIESMTLTSGLDDRKNTVSIDPADWVEIINMINTAKRSNIAEEYQPSYGELYPIINTLTVSANEQGAAKTYSLMIYNHKDWDVFHGEYEYKLALNCSLENGKTELWGLPYAEGYRLMEWINGIRDSKQNNDINNGGASDMDSDMDSDTTDIAKLVEDNISIIMSSPKTSSNPQDYINAHQNEYENFFKYGGEDALQYMLTQFEAGNAEGLRGQIMMRVCKELLGARNNVTDESLSPQEWYSALSIRQEILLPNYEYDGQDRIEKLVYDTEIERDSASNKRGGFIIVAPKIFASYEEEDLLKVFVTTYSARYKLFGNTLSQEGGSIIPAAITYRKDNSGRYILEKYQQAGDGSEFDPSIREYCTMPVSGREIKGLADKIFKHYTNYGDIRTLLYDNLFKHLKKNRIKDATLANSQGEVEFSMSNPKYKP